MLQDYLWRLPCIPEILKNHLQYNKIAYQDVNVASDKSSRDEMVAKTGQIAVPVIEIDGEISVGYDEKWLKEKLNL